MMMPSVKAYGEMRAIRTKEGGEVQRENGRYYCVGDEAWFPKYKTISKHSSFEEACRVAEYGGDRMADDPGYRAFLKNKPDAW